MRCLRIDPAAWRHGGSLGSGAIGLLPSRTRKLQAGGNPPRRKPTTMPAATSACCWPPDGPHCRGPGLGAERHLDRPPASRQGLCAPLFARDLLNTLRQRELDEATAKLAAEIGLARLPSAEGEYVLGVYRRRVTLAAGRFAMIDDGMGFQLAPWSPALDQTFSDREADRTIPPARRSTGWSRPGRP